MQFIDNDQLKLYEYIEYKNKMKDYLFDLF